MKRLDNNEIYLDAGNYAGLILTDDGDRGVELESCVGIGKVRGSGFFCPGALRVLASELQEAAALLEEGVLFPEQEIEVNGYMYVLKDAA